MINAKTAQRLVRQRLNKDDEEKERKYQEKKNFEKAERNRLLNDLPKIIKLIESGIRAAAKRGEKTCACEIDLFAALYISKEICAEIQKSGFRAHKESYVEQENFEDTTPSTNTRTYIVVEWD